MGWVILAIGMIFFLIAGDIDSQRNQNSRTAIQTQSGQFYASQFLTIANRVNDWRYKTGQKDGAIPTDQLGLPFTPDSRIQYRLLPEQIVDLDAGTTAGSLMHYGHRVAVRHLSAP